MVSVKELKKLIAEEKKKQAKGGSLSEKSKLKQELFELKHGGKVKVMKKIGKGLKTAGGNLAYNVKWASGKFQKQRKKKKGIGGFLQGIADKQ